MGRDMQLTSEVEEKLYEINTNAASAIRLGAYTIKETIDWAKHNNLFQGFPLAILRYILS